MGNRSISWPTILLDLNGVPYCGHSCFSSEWMGLICFIEFVLSVFTCKWMQMEQWSKKDWLYLPQHFANSILSTHSWSDATPGRQRNCSMTRLTDAVNSLLPSVSLSIINSGQSESGKSDNTKLNSSPLPDTEPDHSEHKIPETVDGAVVMFACKRTFNRVFPEGGDPSGMCICALSDCQSTRELARNIAKQMHCLRKYHDDIPRGVACVASVCPKLVSE